jgi:hypothetical protein
MEVQLKSTTDTYKVKTNEKEYTVNVYKNIEKGDVRIQSILQYESQDPWIDFAEREQIKEFMLQFLNQ